MYNYWVTYPLKTGEGKYINALSFFFVSVDMLNLG